MTGLNASDTGKQVDFRAPSKTANVGEKVADPMHQLTKWQRKFSEEELNRYQKILDHFKVTYYSAFDALPNTKLAI